MKAIDASLLSVVAMFTGQLALFGNASAAQIDEEISALERITLDHGAWLELRRGWLRGHRIVFDHLVEHVVWRSETRVMYDRTVEVPRQYAMLGDGHRDAGHPIISSMRYALDRRYGTRFERVSAALYRDGRDSVAFHGDYVARRMPEALVATVSVGASRKLLLRPTGGGRSTSLMLDSGDLLVMGGTCQRTYQHAIPKVGYAGPRIAIMFRPVWKETDTDAPPTTEQEGEPAR